MLTLFDRYLLQRYWHTYFISFAAMLGLYVVIDAFSNVDEFTRSSKPLPAMMAEMLRYYAFRACGFFHTIGSIISILASVLTLALVLKNGELNPILSAGLPTYRLAPPLVLGTMLINGVMIANQELLIPRIADELQTRPGQDASSFDRIKPNYDFSSRILIASGQLFLRTRVLKNAEFVLPVPEIAKQLTTVMSTEARFLKRGRNGQAGWLLQGVKTRFDEISLTPRGRETIFPGDAPDELFVVTDLSFDQLMNRNKTYHYLSTMELLDRVKNPAYGTISVRNQSLHLHTRFTRPLMNVLVVLLAIPLIVRREARGLVVSLALSVAAVMLAMASAQAFEYLGTANIVRLDLAAWAPVVLCGTCCAWFTGYIRT